MRRILSIIMFVLLLLQLPVLADGNPNIDGGGGGMEGGDVASGSYWHVGDDGVRITVVKESTKASVTTPLDFSNIDTSDIMGHFNGKNKLQYGSLNAAFTKYKAEKFDVLPPIISANGGTNIEVVRNYFKDENVIKLIAQKTGMKYEKLISGDYVLLIEPILYFNYGKMRIAATATEAALYDQLEDGRLRKAMGYATHQNLPLSMFLELPQLGYPAYSGKTSGIVDNATIIGQLGLGIVNFKEQACCDHPPDCPCLEGKPPESPDCSCKEEHPDLPCEPETPGCKCKPKISTWDYEYRTDTEVITAVRVHSGGEINPDHGAAVTFGILGNTYSKGYVIPAGESQLVWVKWRTPKTPQVVNISVYASRGSTEKGTIVCNVVDLKEKTPPDPQGRDRNNGFKLGSKPSYPVKKTASWGEWYAYWVPFWVWVSESCGDEDCDSDHGYWEDQGWWEFEWHAYSASLSTNIKATPDEKVPTDIAQGDSFEIKSGYGYNIEYGGDVSSSRNYDVTPIQNVVTLFPEFGYKTYFRKLEAKIAGYRSEWEFFQNKYSMTKQRAHFTPIWYPDSAYEVYAIGFDAWTPDGMLCGDETFAFDINGDVYMDWMISPYA